MNAPSEEPGNQPKWLFKYVSAERALSCLPEIGDGALRATQPAGLNDPFECSARKIFVERDRREGNLAFSRVLTEIQPLSPVSREDVESARERHGSLYMGELYRMQLSKRYGIVSFSSNQFHPLLWSHYAQDGSGFAIGYRAESLKGLLKRGGIHLRKVRYIDRPGIVMGYRVLSTPESNPVHIMSCKGDHWEYESEWRLIVELNQTIGTGERDRHDQPVNLFRIPNHAVDRVYHTERTPPEIISKINIRLLAPNNRYGPRSATKLVLSEDEFRYEEYKAALPVWGMD